MPEIHSLPDRVLGDEEGLDLSLPGLAHRPGQQLPLELLLVLLLTGRKDKKNITDWVTT